MIVSPTNSEILALSDKVETQRKRQPWGKSQTIVLVSSLKENFKLKETASSQCAWAKLKASEDATGPAKNCCIVQR